MALKILTVTRIPDLRMLSMRSKGQTRFIPLEIAGFVVAVIACLAAVLVVPEMRRVLRLDPGTDAPTSTSVAGPVPGSSPSITLTSLPRPPQPTLTTIPGWEGRQREYQVGEIMKYSIFATAPEGGGSDVTLAVDPNSNYPYSLSQRAIISRIDDLRVCSSTFVKNARCPDPAPENDTEVIQNTWIRNGDAIEWKISFTVPYGKAVSATLEFIARPDAVKDGDLIHVTGVTISASGRKESPGQLYVIRVP